MPDTATVTLDPSEVQDAGGGANVPTLDASEVVDKSPGMSKQQASAAIDQYASGGLGNRPASPPPTNLMPQFNAPQKPLDAASQEFEREARALPAQQSTQIVDVNKPQGQQTISQQAAYQPKFRRTPIDTGNITNPAQPVAPKMQSSADAAAAAINQDPQIKLMRGQPIQSPLSGAVATTKAGLAQMKQGLDLLGPENFADNSAEGAKQTEEGYNNLLKGIMTASSPEVTMMIGANPLPFVRGMITGTISGVALQKVTQAAGASPQFQDLAKTVGFFLPTAAGFLTSATGSIETAGATTRGTAEAFGGGVKGGFQADPYTVKVAGRVGRTGVGAEFERFPGAKAQRAANYGQPQPPPPPDPAMQQHQADTAGAVKALTDSAAADANAARAAAGVPPPPPPKPPMPAGMDQGELRPAVLANLAQVVQIAPANMRAGMFLEAHKNLTAWLMTNRTVILPDGKLQTIDSPKKAESVAQDVLNDEVERHQQAHQDMLDQKVEQQKQAKEQADQETEQAAPAPNEDGEEENPLILRAKTILAANADVPPQRQVALLQRQLRVGLGMAQKLMANVARSQPAAGAAGMVGSSTEQVTEEPREQIDRQIASLAGGTIPVVHLPEGTQYRPQVPPGMKMIRVSGDAPGAGTFIYNPAKIQAAAIKEAAKNGTHGDLLGHIAQKADIPGMRVPAILQASTPDGKPIQESVVDAADPQMVRAQAEALRERHPGAHVQARHPEMALNERDHALARDATGGGDIFDHIAQERGKGEGNAIQKQGAAGVLSQPGGPEEGRGESGEGVRPGEQGREESARQGAGEKEVTQAQGPEGGRGEPERGERRRDTAQRRRIAEMSPEEMQRELLTSEKTGLPNRRAFEDAEHAAPAKAIAMSDADGLKALNDQYGYAAGDQLLKAKAEELRAAGLESYHDKGDEFIHRGESIQDLNAKLEVAREGLRNREIEVTMKDGTVRRFKGADFSHGAGKDADAAESKLKQHKSDREARGERARGELRGIQETGPQADRRRESAAPKTTIAKGDTGVRFRDDHGVERTGTVLHTNDRITRLRLGSGAENTVKNADIIGARPIPEPGGIGELHSSQMVRAPKDFQYKSSNIGEGGVSSLLQGSAWNDELSGIVSAWRDPANGKVYVVNGHHRHERAEATGGQKLAVRMLAVENREEARAAGALQNISEGRGTAIDAAKFMRSSGMTLEHLEKRGISMGEATAQNGVALARLDPTIFEQVATGKLSERKGIAIGRATDNPATQEAIVKMIAKAEARGRHVSEGAVQELARFAASAGETEQTVESLFGNRVETQNLALEKADVSAYIQKQLRQEKTIFGAVSSEARAKTLSRTGNKIQAKKNAAEAVAASQALEVYDRLSARRGPVDDALNDAAKEIADGKPANNAKQRAYDAIRIAVHQALGSVEGAGARGSEADAGRGPRAEEEKEGPTAQELEDAGQGGIVFSRLHGPVTPRLTPADPFYLKSARVIDAKMHGPMNGADLRRMLENAGVKADEIQWTGLGELFDGDQKITPDQVRELLAQDRAKLTEVVKGNQPSIPEGELPKGWTVEQVDDGTGEHDELWEVRDDNDRHIVERPSEESAVAEARRIAQGGDVVKNATSYEQYVLPGGANYREMLLTLPAPGMKFDPSKVTFKRTRRSVTQGSTGIFYDGKELGTYGDDPELNRETGAYEQKPDSFWMDAARQVFDKSAGKLAGAFTTRHWDEPNVLTHIRFNDRESLTYTPADIDAIGKKIATALGTKESSLASGSPAVAIRKGAITALEGAQYAHAKNYRDVPKEGAVRKLLHVEEVQSDWHQKGRAKGYKQPELSTDRPKFIIRSIDEHSWGAYDDAGKLLGHVGKGTVSTAADAKLYMERYLGSKIDEAAKDRRIENAERPPDAPFKKTWHELALRRMLHHAAENGYDGLSWTPGEKQAERYDLSKQVDAISYAKGEDGTYSISVRKHDGPRRFEEVLSKRGMNHSELADVIGKEAAQKVVDGIGHEVGAPEGSGELKGLDLKVGGEGMRGFYDKIVPAYLNKLGKQWGAKVGETRISSKNLYDSKNDADWKPEEARILHRGDQFQVWAPNSNGVDQLRATYAEKDLAVYHISSHVFGQRGDTPVPYLPITDAMRKSVTEEGQPLFSPAKLDATPEQRAKAQRLTTSDPKFHYLDGPGVAKLYQKNLRGVVLEGETPALPGLEHHVEEHQRSAEEVSAEALKQAGAKDISGAAGRMERDSPLFRDSGASEQGALFTKPKPPQPGTGQQRMSFEAPSAFKQKTPLDQLAYYREAGRAEDFTLPWNIRHATVTVHPAAKGSAPVVELNPHAYQAINKIIRGDAGHNISLDEWGGCFMPSVNVRKFQAALEEQGKKLGDDAADKLWQEISKGLAPGGGLILARGDLSAAGVREELAHWWYNRNIYPDLQRDMSDTFVASAIYQRAVRLLREQGYPINRMHETTVLNEILSKSLADIGGDLMPLDPSDGRVFLSQALFYLKREMDPVTFTRALDTLPEISPAARAIIDEWRRYDDDQGRGALSTTAPEGRISGAQGDRQGSPRGPPEGPDSAILHTPQGEPAEPRGRDEVARQRDLPDEGADEEMSPLENFMGAITDYIRSDSELTEGKLQRGIMRETRGQMDRRIAQTATALEKDRSRWARKSHDEFLKFADAVEKVGDAKVADLDPKEQKLAQYFQDQYWKRIETIRALKEGALQDLIENYISHNWERPGLAKSTLKQVFSGRRPFAGRGSFLKQRTIPTIREGIELGLRPKTWNPVEDFLHKILDMDRFIMGHQTLMGMKQAGTAKMVRIGQQPPEGWQQLDDRIGTVQSKSDDGGLVVRGHYYAPADAAKPFNNFVSRGIAGKSQIYDTLRWANDNMNALQLGVSFFHAMTTTNNAIASDVALAAQELSRGQVGSGAARLVRGATMVPSVVQTLRNGSKLMAEYLSPGSYAKFAEEANALAVAGGRPKMDVLQPKPLQQIINHFRNGEVFRGGGKILGSIIHATTAPVLDYWVPRMKVGAFYADAHSVLEYARKRGWTPERTRAEIQKAWDSADHRFGQVVYDNLFWHKALRDMLQLSQRAVGWNYGTAAGVGGAIPEAARAAGRVATGDVSDFGTLLGRAMSFVVGMTVATGLMGALLEYHWQKRYPRQAKDFFFPQRPDGQRVSIPGYMKDVFAFAHAPVQTVLNKLAPVFSMMADLYQNRDFYRVEIRHSDDNWLKQSEDVGKYLGRTLEPFSVRAQTKMLQSQGAGVDTGARAMLRTVLTHPEDAALGQLGFQPAAAYIQNTPAQNMAYQFSVENNPPGTRTEEQFERSQIKQAIAAMHRTGHVDNAQIQQYLKSGQITAKDVRTAAAEAKTDPLVLSVRHGELTLRQLLDVYQQANRDEQRKLRPILQRKAATLQNEPNPETRRALGAQLRKALGSATSDAVHADDAAWEHPAALSASQ